MKLKQFTTVVAVGSLIATFSFLNAQENTAPAAQTDKPAAEAPAEAKVPVFVVTVSGKG